MANMSSNREIIANLYRHFENKDIAAVSEIVAEDIVMDLPYSPDGYPKRLIGKKDFTHHMASGLAAYAK
jgi:ketosteroid isomerase-like protein